MGTLPEREKDYIKLLVHLVLILSNIFLEIQPEYF